MCCSRPVHEAMMSSGCAVWPLVEVIYFGLPVEESSTIEGGSEDGSWRKLYGSVTAVGNERKGETVRGTCARSGCGSDKH